MGEKLGWVSQKVLMFAHADPVAYSATCVAMTITLAYCVDRFMHYLLYSRKHH